MKYLVGEGNDIDTFMIIESESKEEVVRTWVRSMLSENDRDQDISLFIAPMSILPAYVVEYRTKPIINILEAPRGQE